MGSKSAGPGLYEFLIEAELQQYYNALKNELKVQNVSQLKYVSEDDMAQIGMSRPEMRRLTKFFHKHCPQTYLAKMKKKLLLRRDESTNSSSLSSQISSPPGGRTVRSVAPGRHIIQADAIVSHKTLGSGEFGTVQQGVWTSEEGERIQVAIKCLSQEKMENNPVEFLKEAAIMHSVDHEHIVRLYGVVLDTCSLVLVTELAPLRSLLECLKEPSMRPNLTLQTLFDFSIQICDGMEYLESKRLIHRDLAARNILVFSKSKVKISDFGLSRALGVGKDYYQTNFNVNLKLPIAWCAPECINFLRFTSASDVWAYGVTLWEMFSYGFQPWAALTGQQILEAIDEPNYHRLERPESSPVEIYYQIMLKCWQHSPSDRPTFAQLLNLLPECKPEQVQAIRESGESGWRRDFLAFEPGDLITVIDKKIGGSTCGDESGAVEWKGVLKCGKTGFFNPANTITYLGPSLPSANGTRHASDAHRFQRNDSRSSSLRKGRISADMISRPQGDLKHTGHVGADGQFFGDIAFINTKCWVPRQVVPPYKPESPISTDEASGSFLFGSQTKGPGDSESEILSNDTDPLLWKGHKETSHPKNWRKLVLPTGGCTEPVHGHNGPAHNQNLITSFDESELDHEYHEISDEENEMMASCRETRKDLGHSNPALTCKAQSPLDSPSFDKAFDLGPSLMDEVFGALELERGKQDFAHEHKSSQFRPKKKFATVKPISSKDRKRLDTAIAIANELASRSMLDLDHVRNSASFDDISSERTPSSPSHRKKFSFLLGYNKGPERERRNYAQEAASIPDIQSTLSEEAKEAYNSLIEKPSSIGSLGLLTPSFENKSSSFHFPEKCSSKKSAFFDKEPLCPPPASPFFEAPHPLTPSLFNGNTSGRSVRSHSDGAVPTKGHTKAESWSGPESKPQVPAPEEEEEEDRNPLRLLRQSKIPNVLPLPPKRNESGQGQVLTKAAEPSSSLQTTHFTKTAHNLQSKHTPTARHQRKHPLLIPNKVPVPFDDDVGKTPPPPPPKPQRQHLPCSPPKESFTQKLEMLQHGEETEPILSKEFCKFEPETPETNLRVYENYEEDLNTENTLATTRISTNTEKQVRENGSGEVMGATNNQAEGNFCDFGTNADETGGSEVKALGNSRESNLYETRPGTSDFGNISRFRGLIDSDNNTHDIQHKSVQFGEIVPENSHNFRSNCAQIEAKSIEINIGNSHSKEANAYEIEENFTGVNANCSKTDTGDRNRFLLETETEPLFKKCSGVYTKTSKSQTGQIELQEIPLTQPPQISVNIERKTRSTNHESINSNTRGGLETPPSTCNTASTPTITLNNSCPQTDATSVINSPKIKTVQRILGPSATEKDCEWALTWCREDSAHAVKLLRLKCLLPQSMLESDPERVVSVLEMSHWDVSRASDFLLNPINQKPKTRTSLRAFPRRLSLEEEAGGSEESSTEGPTPKYIRPTRV